MVAPLRCSFEHTFKSQTIAGASLDVKKKSPTDDLFLIRSVQFTMDMFRSSDIEERHTECDLLCKKKKKKRSPARTEASTWRQGPVHRTSYDFRRRLWKLNSVKLIWMKEVLGCDRSARCEVCL